MNNQQGFRFYFMRAVLVCLLSVGLYLALMWRGNQTQYAKTITVYAYSDTLSSEVFEAFEKRTGITVNVKHFEAVEEIMTKLLFAKESDIDLILPTDAMVEVLCKHQLLQPLQRAALSHWHALDRRLLGKFFDIENRYAVPVSWTPLGIGYDTRFVQAPKEGIDWDILLGTLQADGLVRPPSIKYGVAVDRVCLGEDPWEGLFLAALHLYGSFDALTELQLEDIGKLLRQQKEWLECYTNNLKYFLISGVSRAVVMPAAYMVLMKSEYSWADFVIPQKGSIMFIPHAVIPRNSKQVDLAYEVINYLLSTEGSMACYTYHAYFPANEQAYALLPKAVTSHQYIFPQGAIFDSLKLFHNKLPLSRVEQLWQGIKL